ncbi:hypothetical protein BDW02DRAFT_509956 [Decorospora gaudefroyi]|uniref:Uncharacterized protein n=1 Tax=Decorospora gaudefroyi TaxID=184978 RepID=A0A6A5JXA2_9PLEO|nr:hypothetical protein BDW02DRAFT_509956 [Decorospora gaudefroyi]
MSSPAPQYVYIPNLVGRQMLRIPIEGEQQPENQHFSLDSQQQQYQQPIASPTLTSRYTREASPSPSVESVDAAE